MPSSEALDAILRATPQALLVVDRDDTIVFVNDEAARLLGQPADDLVGRPAKPVVGPIESSAAVEAAPVEARTGESLVLFTIGRPGQAGAGAGPGASDLGNVARGIAHDLNNLLGVILNYAALLTDQVSDPDALDDIAEIRRAAELAADLTRQLSAAGQVHSVPLASHGGDQVDG